MSPSFSRLLLLAAALCCTAGAAEITTTDGATTTFSGNSNGGNAALINTGTGVVDFSASNFNSGQLTAGSIAGSGTYNLGGDTLTVGSNGTSTEVSGTISDGGLGGGTGASLVKTGAGTLTLSGANTHTGATTIDAGALADRERFERDVQTDLVPETKAVGDGARDAVDANGLSIDAMLLDTKSEHGR